MIKIYFFFFYITISISILILGLINSDLLLIKLLILALIGFLLIGLKDHLYEIKSLTKMRNSDDRKIYENIKIVIGCSFAAMITWHINHGMDYGPIIANGLVGVIAGLIFSPKEAGAYYITSFIGMSSQTIVASMTIAGVIGLIAGLVIILSQEVYAGIGGKGGTISAMSTQLFRLIMSFFI